VSANELMVSGRVFGVRPIVLFVCTSFLFFLAFPARAAPASIKKTGLLSVSGIPRFYFFPEYGWDLEITTEFQRIHDIEFGFRQKFGLVGTLWEDAVIGPFATIEFGWFHADQSVLEKNKTLEEADKNVGNFRYSTSNPISLGASAGWALQLVGPNGQLFPVKHDSGSNNQFSLLFSQAFQGGLDGTASFMRVLNIGVKTMIPISDNWALGGFLVFGSDILSMGSRYHTDGLFASIQDEYNQTNELDFGISVILFTDDEEYLELTLGVSLLDFTSGFSLAFSHNVHRPKKKGEIGLRFAFPDRLTLASTTSLQMHLVRRRSQMSPACDDLVKGMSKLADRSLGPIISVTFSIDDDREWAGLLIPEGEEPFTASNLEPGQILVYAEALDSHGAVLLKGCTDTDVLRKHTQNVVIDLKQISKSREVVPFDDWLDD